MTKSEYEVVIDIHEPQKVVDAFEDHERVSETKDVPLPAGDIGVNENVLCERKTCSDFSSSVTGSQRNIFEQVEKMQETMDTPPYILIEGNMEDFDGLWHTDVNPKALRGAVCSLTVRKGAHVLFCSDLASLVDVALSIADKHTSEPSSSHLHSGSVDVKEPVTKRVFGQLSGVGSKTAGNLHEEYSSVEEIMSATPEQLETVDGVGEKRAESIHAALR